MARSPADEQDEGHFGSQTVVMLNLFGAVALAFMMLMYALESRGRAFILALWMHPDGREPTPEEQTQLAALRRVASLLGIHFLEERGDDLVETVRRVARERGTTYIFVGTPDESRRREIFGGSLLSRMVREIPGIDIRVIADRALREEEPK
jgi:K+-sensing histidine kinase KdpD